MSSGHSSERRQRTGRSIAFWAGVAAFLANVVALKVVDIFNTAEIFHLLGVFVASLCVGGAVYARERVQDARMERLDNARLEHWHIAEEENGDP